MINFLNHLKTNKKILNSIISSCKFEDNYLFRNKSKNLIGIKMIFDDNSTAILWTNSNKNVINYSVFNTVVSININKKQSQLILDKFLNTFNNYYQFIDI